MIVKHIATGLFHRAEDTQSGVLTSCNLLLTGTSYHRMSWTSLDLAGESGCNGCKNPVQQSLVSPFKTRRTGKTNRPQWRTSYNMAKEALENARLAHKEIIAAIEWLERGEEGQFVKNGVDRMSLAYRFIQESLVAFKIIEKPIVPEDG